MKAWMVAPGVLASLLSAFVGVHILVAAVAALAFAVSPWIGSTTRLLMLLSVPIVVASTAALETVLAWQMAIWLVIAGGWVATLGLWLGLGRISWWGHVALAGVLALAFMLLWLLPQSATFYRSDIMTRMQVAVAAMVLLVATSAGGTLQAYLRR